MTRILLVGSGQEWELTRSYERAFASLGAEVLLFDYYGHLARVSSTLRSKHTSLGLLPLARRSAAFALIRTAARCDYDLCIFIKCDDLPSFTYGLLRRVSPRMRLFAFHPDDPYNIRFLRGPSHRRAIQQARSVDHYFIWSHRILQRLKNDGVSNISYLGFGVDPHFTTPQEEQEGDVDVSFVGNWDEKREAWLIPLVRSNLRVAVYGILGWSDRCRSPALRHAFRGPATGPEVARALGRAVCSVNVLRHQNEGGENMRTYEIPGASGIMLAEGSPQQEALFPHGREAFYASSPEDLAIEARRIVSMTREARAVIRKAAAEKAGEHTYSARAKTLLQTFRDVG